MKYLLIIALFIVSCDKPKPINSDSAAPVQQPYSTIDKR